MPFTSLIGFLQPKKRKLCRQNALFRGILPHNVGRVQLNPNQDPGRMTRFLDSGQLVLETVGKHFLQMKLHAFLLMNVNCMPNLCTYQWLRMSF